MGRMGSELLVHMETAARDSKFLDALRARVANVAGDLETIVEDIDNLCSAERVLPAYGGAVDTSLIESARLTRAEIEWFVQHACERVRAETAAALWGPLVRKSGQIDVTVATTNYDRAIEHACQRYGVVPIDGFGPFAEREWASWDGFGPSGLRLLKLHGSTDWYQVRGTGAVLKLRHPMPLFGGVTLHLEDAGLALPSWLSRVDATYALVGGGVSVLVV